MLNDKYLSELGEVILFMAGKKAANDQDCLMLGKSIQHIYQKLLREQERDMRDANNGKWGDEAAERRMDVVGQNGNVGYE